MPAKKQSKPELPAGLKMPSYSSYKTSDALVAMFPMMCAVLQSPIPDLSSGGLPRLLELEAGIMRLLAAVRAQTLQSINNAIVLLELSAECYRRQAVCDLIAVELGQTIPKPSEMISAERSIAQLIDHTPDLFAKYKAFERAVLHFLTVTREYRLHVTAMVETDGAQPQSTDPELEDQPGVLVHE
ncbi:unnamed protein product, partial [Mesorhabditis spiculigera]